jgi:hypothetical protein
MISCRFWRRSSNASGLVDSDFSEGRLQTFRVAMSIRFLKGTVEA